MKETSETHDHGARPHGAQSTPALVIGGIGIVRNLGEEGIPVYAGSDVRENHILHSRYATKRVFFTNFTGPEFVEELIALGKKEGRKLLFFSDDDRAILTFARAQEALKPYYYFTIPPADLVDSILDKRRFVELAKNLDLPVPWSQTPRSMDDLNALLPEITYPCIIKPAHKEDWWTPKFAQYIGDYRKAIECSSKEELLQYFPKVLQVSPNVLIQELVEGDDSQLYSINMFFDGESNLMGFYSAHKHRTYPIHAGQGCCVESIKDDEILSVSLETATKLKMIGLCNMQYKRDVNGRLKIMELHIRNSVWSYLGKACGMNLYYYAYLHEQGHAYPYPNDYRTGIKFIDLKRDIKSLLAYRKTGEWTIRRGIESWKGEIVFHILSLKDPMPFFADVWFEIKQRLFSKRLDQRSVE